MSLFTSACTHACYACTHTCSHVLYIYMLALLPAVITRSYLTNTAIKLLVVLDDASVKEETVSKVRRYRRAHGCAWNVRCMCCHVS